VSAGLKPSQLEVVREALAAVHVTRLTVCDAQGYDAPRGPGPIVQQTVIEVAVNEDFVARAVAALTAPLGPPPPPGGRGRRGLPRGRAGAVNAAWGARAGDAITAAIGPTDAPEARILVLPIAEAVQLYREVRGPEAV